MSDAEADPYAVSSDEDEAKGPPPKIEIEGRTTADFQQIKESLINDENKAVKDENTLKEIEELRIRKGQELKTMKEDFESGKITGAEGVQKQADDFQGLDRQTLSSFKDKFENLDATLNQNVKDKLQAGGTNIADELSQIQSLKEKKADWQSSATEGREDVAKNDEELEELKRAGVKVKERFQPPAAGDVQKSYDASELQGSGAADARKSFIEGSAYQGSVEKKTVEPLDVQLRNLKQAFEKPEAEMSLEERTEKKKREIEEEFLRYKMARNGPDTEQGEDDALDVKGLMDKFKNIEDLAPKQIAGKLDELEQLRVEASSLRERFEKAAESGELTEEKRRQLDEEFASLREERERAKRELEEEQAEAAALAGQQTKEEVQIAADHAQKMTAKWEKMHAKEAKKAEKSKMPQKE